METTLDVETTAIRAAGRALCALALLCAAVADAGAAQPADASGFPARPIRMISPFPPGGSNDILGRLIAQKLSERLGRQTIVENRPGAAGVIGTELAARAPADGHTIVMVATTYAQVPAIQNVPFDPVIWGPMEARIMDHHRAVEFLQKLASEKRSPSQAEVATFGRVCDNPKCEMARMCPMKKQCFNLSVV